MPTIRCDGSSAGASSGWGFMTTFATRLLLVGMVVITVGCLDLSEDGKVFACESSDECDAGGGGGAGGGTGGGIVECSCQLPEATCQGNTRISAAASRCLADAGCDFQLIETACPAGCAAGACVGEPCLGMVCSQPPKAKCESATALRVFTTPGACQAGGCLYASAQVSCDCENDHCKSNPCIGVTCAQPPSATCLGASLRTWQSPGTCDAATGRCAYATADTACGIGGCNAGQCTNDKCAGVVCNQPPAATCLGTTAVQISATPGTCSATSGACSYATQTVTCDPGKQCSQGACVEVSVSCNASNCTGCCEGNTCVPVASQSNVKCGGSGGACGSCGGGAPVCESGTCVSKCVGVSCNAPPTAVCFDGTTLTQWSGGSCNPSTGACTYASANVTCGMGNTCSGGVCSCVSESEATLCARLAKNCGAVSSNDNCGVPRTVTCGSCTLPQTCAGGVCACVPEPDATFCGRLGKNCGTVSGTDNCGAARTASCGTCPANSSCGGNNVCSCTPEADANFCSRLGKNCGTVTGTDNCSQPRSAACGSCTGPQTCGATNVCACVPETTASFCGRLGKNCGAVVGVDNCGGTRNTSCGSCTAPQTCGANNVCACGPETDATYCARQGATCGSLQGTDNCGAARLAVCGSCTLPQTCNAGNTCSCIPESNGNFCNRYAKNCGTYSATDNCGSSRTAACGSCTSPQSCGGGGTSNVCGGNSRLNFSNSWQVIPNTGSQTVEFMCNGTVTTTAAGGTKCSGTEPVRFRINGGSTYQFYPGCDGDRPSNCMTSITPSGSTYASWGLTAAGKLLCDAMGWPFSKGLSDNNPGTVDRPVAVVQTAPSVIGTDSGLKNYSTYVTCEP